MLGWARGPGSKVPSPETLNEQCMYSPMRPAPAAKIAVRTASRSLSGTKPTSLYQSMRAGASGATPSRLRAPQTMSARPPCALSTLVWAAMTATPALAARRMRSPG